MLASVGQQLIRLVVLETVERGGRACTHILSRGSALNNQKPYTYARAQLPLAIYRGINPIEAGGPSHFARLAVRQRHVVTSSAR